MSTRWSINITPIERAARIVLGSLTALAGLVLLTGATSALAVTLDVLLVRCRARPGRPRQRSGTARSYARLGHVPTSLKGRTS